MEATNHPFTEARIFLTNLCNPVARDALTLMVFIDERIRSIEKLTTYSELPEGSNRTIQTWIRSRAMLHIGDSPMNSYSDVKSFDVIMLDRMYDIAQKLSDGFAYIREADPRAVQNWFESLVLEVNPNWIMDTTHYDLLRAYVACVDRFTMHCAFSSYALEEMNERLYYPDPFVMNMGAFNFIEGVVDCSHDLARIIRANHLVNSSVVNDVLARYQKCFARKTEIEGRGRGRPRKIN